MSGDTDMVELTMGGHHLFQLPDGRWHAQWSSPEVFRVLQ